MAGAIVLMPLLCAAAILGDAALWAAASAERPDHRILVVLTALVTSQMTVVALLFITAEGLRIWHALLLVLVLLVALPLARFDLELRGAVMLLFALVATIAWNGRWSLVHGEPVASSKTAAGRTSIGGLMKLTIVVAAYAVAARDTTTPREVLLFSVGVLLAASGALLARVLLGRHLLTWRFAALIAVVGLCLSGISDPWRTYLLAHFGLLAAMLGVLRQSGFRLERTPWGAAEDSATASKVAARCLRRSARPFAAP